MGAFFTWLATYPALDWLLVFAVGGVLVLVGTVAIGGALYVVMYGTKLIRRRDEFFSTPLGKLISWKIGPAEAKWEEVREKELEATRNLESHLQAVQKDIVTLKDAVLFLKREIDEERQRRGSLGPGR